MIQVTKVTEVTDVNPLSSVLFPEVPMRFKGVPKRFRGREQRSLRSYTKNDTDKELINLFIVNFSFTNLRCIAIRALVTERWFCFQSYTQKGSRTYSLISKEKQQNAAQFAMRNLLLMDTQSLNFWPQHKSLIYTWSFLPKEDSHLLVNSVMPI